tara:strand:+ start:633 stop:974 length:342 start_codon:yes stop_codon:yes gene_type:complete
MKGNKMALVYENMPSKEKKLKQIAKVENMLSNRSHKPVANQFKITMQNGLEVFQSYETIICIKDPRNNEIYLDKNCWDYSNTTSRYRKFFLQEDTKTTRDKINKGVYFLVDLN